MAVAGLSCSDFISSHAPGSASSGNLRKNCGTKPSVFAMSARAAAAAVPLAAPVLAAPSARARAATPSRSNATKPFTSLVLMFMVMVLPLGVVDDALRGEDERRPLDAAFE